MGWLLDLFPSWRRPRRRRGKRTPVVPSLRITSLEARRVLDGEFSISGAAAVAEGAAAQYEMAMTGTVSEGQSTSVQVSLTDGATNDQDHGDLIAALEAAVSSYSGPGSLALDSGTGLLSYTGGTGGTTMTPLTFDLAATDDTLVEGSEDYTIALTIPGDVPVVIGSVTTTIADNDTATWSLTGDTSVTESGPGAATYTVSLAGTLQDSETASIVLTLTDGETTSADHSDFAAAVSAAVGEYAGPGTLTFNSETGVLTYQGGEGGTAMTALVISLSAVDDSLVEGPEDFTVSLANPGSTSGAQVAGSGSVTTTIADNDTATWSLTGDTSVTESGPGAATYTVSLAGTLQDSETASIVLTLTDGETTSADHSDFAAAVSAAVGEYAGPGTLTFNSETGVLTYQGGEGGTAMTALVISLSAVDDSLVEGPEAYTVSLASPGSTSGAQVAGSGSVTTTIADNDTATWSLTGDTSLTESGPGSATYTVSLAGTLQDGETASIVLTLTDGETTSADHSDFAAAVSAAVDGYAGPGTLTFNSETGVLTYQGGEGGTAMSALEISLSAVDDSLVEGPEAYTVSLASPGSTSGAQVAGSGSVTTTIADNDTLTVEFSTANSGDAEASGGNLAVLLVTGQVQAGYSVTVSAAVTGGTATGADYTNTAAITIGAGSYDGTLGTAVATHLAITDDSLLEPDETIQLTLTTGSPQVALGNWATTHYTILDDDQLTVQFDTASSGDAEASGGKRAVLLVTGQVQAGYSVTVAVAVTGGTATAADYTNTATVAIGAGSYDGTASTAVATNLAITDELLVEPDETLQLTLTTASPEVLLGAITATQYTIRNDDQLTVEFDTASSGDAEASGGNLPQLLVTGQVQDGYQVTIQVDVGGASTASGGGTDFSEPAALTLAGGVYENALIAVPGLGIRDDSLVEPDETVVLDLVADELVAVGDANGDESVLGSSTYTIRDDDQVRVEFDTANSGDAEAGGGNLAVLLVTGEVQAGYSVAVSVAVTGGTATGSDYVNTAAVTIGGGVYDGTAGTALATHLAITDDALVEPDETIQLTLTTASAQVAIGAPDTTWYTIRDDDRLVVEFNTASSGDAEAGGGNLAVLLVTGQVQAGYSVAVSVAVTGGTATGADYVNTAAVMIGGGVYDGTAGTAVATHLAITDDGVVEPDETIQLTLSTVSPQVALGPADATLYTIRDDDYLVVAFDRTTSSDLESGGGNLAVLWVTGEVQAGYSVSVSVAVTGGTATDSDYTNTPAVTIGGGVYDGSSGTAVATNLAITDDSVVEPDETIQLTLTTDSAQVVRGEIVATAYTIVNEDTATLTIGNVEKFEGTGGGLTEFAFTVTLDNDVQGGFKVPFVTFDQTALHQGGVLEQDYWEADGQLVFSGVQGEVQTITVQVAADAWIEQNESFQVLLGSLLGIDPTAADDISVQAVGLGTILNDDVVPPQFFTLEAQSPTPLPTFAGLPEAPLPPVTQMVFLESPDWGRGGAEASRVEEDVVELRLVVPRGDGTFEEQSVVRLPVDQLGKIRELLGRLPDDRYRFYYLRRDGASWLIIDVMLRDGKPVDPADIEPGRPTPAPPAATPLPPADAVPPAAAPAAAKPAAAFELPEQADAGRPWRTRQTLASGAALAACLPWSDWQQRVHAALAQRSRGAGQLRVRRQRRAARDPGDQ